MFRIVGLVVLLAALAVGVAAPAPAQEPPRTGFEERNGASWTTHDEEVAFLEAVDAASDRVTLTEIGRTLEDRPLHLVSIGHPAPRIAAGARAVPVSLFICSQHGNEPAGREACLRWLRDLAFTEDPTLLAQLHDQVVLFVPAANPDGRARNSRGNAEGTDINRDHLNLETPEARAIAAVVRDWQPEITVDLHEFGSTAVVYDDDLLYLWPRNLNVDSDVRSAARTLAEDYVKAGAEDNGQRAGEYGRERVPVADFHIDQIAGDEDEGIARNLFGLRHSAGLLLETRVGADPRSGVNELNSTPAVQNRRVDTHYRAVADSLRYMREEVDRVTAATAGAPVRKEAEGRDRSAPVYFDGQDEDGTLDGSGEAEPTTVADPPPCGYALTAEQAAGLATVFDLHGIHAQPRGDGTTFVPMAQPAEPVIPLLLDARGRRNAVEGEALQTC